MEHRVQFTVEGCTGTFVKAFPCPYPHDDQTRPCWPHDDDGEPMDAPQPDCTWVGWVEAVGMECMGTFEFEAPVVAEWVGDSPLFEQGYKDAPLRETPDTDAVRDLVSTTETDDAILRNVLALCDALDACRQERDVWADAATGHLAAVQERDAYWNEIQCNGDTISTLRGELDAAEQEVGRLLAALAASPREATGAERYLASRLDDPEYRAAYEAAREATEPEPVTDDRRCPSCGGTGRTEGEA